MLSILFMQGNVVFATELARRYGDQGIVSTALHPGPIKSDLYRDVPYLLPFAVRRRFSYASCLSLTICFAKTQSLIMYPASQGAVTSLWAGTSPEGAKLGGKVTLCTFQKIIQLNF